MEELITPLAVADGNRTTDDFESAVLQDTPNKRKARSDVVADEC